MLKLSQSIPEVIDPSNPQALQEYLVAIKLCVEEIVRKAKSIQSEVKSTAPTKVTDFEVEGESVRASIGGISYEYQLVNGEIKYVTFT